MNRVLDAIGLFVLRCLSSVGSVFSNTSHRLDILPNDTPERRAANAGFKLWLASKSLRFWHDTGDACDRYLEHEEREH